jgi:hypothetical protein
MADNWLKDYGFNVIRLPRTNLAPGDVLYRSKDEFRDKVGDLKMVFSSDTELPKITSGEPVGDLAYSAEKKVDTSLGIKILGSLLGGISSSQLGAHLSSKHARKLAVKYEEIQQDSLPVLELQSWIQTAHPQLSGQGAAWLNDGKLAAVSAVLKTKKLSIVAELDDGGAIELTVPEIQGVISGDATVTVESASSSRITFTGAQPIAFGLQAYVMNFSGNVSFGIDEIRGGLTEPSYEGLAWTADDSLEIHDVELPG